MPKKILIVDDDTSICNSLALLLRGEGYCVDALTDSEQAAILIKKDKYDACLFDYKMKGLNGLDLLILTKDVNPSCPVFIVSGMLNIDKLCRKQINAGLVASIISKPFDVEVLLQKMSAVI